MINLNLKENYPLTFPCISWLMRIKLLNQCHPWDQLNIKSDWLFSDIEPRYRFLLNKNLIVYCNVKKNPGWSDIEDSCYSRSGISNLGKLEHISLWVKHRQMEMFGAAVTALWELRCPWNGNWPWRILQAIAEWLCHLARHKC